VLSKKQEQFTPKPLKKLTVGIGNQHLRK